MSMRTGLAMGVMAACMFPGFAYAEGGVQSQKDITWGLGLEIAQAAIAECAKRNVASRLRSSTAPAACAFSSSDNPSPHSLELARRKAYTARTFRRSTLEWRDNTEPGKDAAGQRQLGEVIPLGGGYPINVGNDTIGGVGVSGNNQAGDEACAKAGVEKVADKLK